jgi:apolipoprotein N-acyltransferase
MKRKDLGDSGLALLSAALCALAAPPVGWWLLAPVALVPLAVAVTGSPVRRAALLGLLHGTVLNGWAFSWMVPALIRVRGLSPPVAASLLLGLAIFHGCRFGLIALLHAWATGRGFRPWSALPLATVTTELVCPMLFPWHVGFLAGAELRWLQLAELGGPLLTSWWVALTSGLLAQAWLGRRRRGSAVKSAAAGVAVIGVVTGAGQVLLARARAQLENAVGARVGFVQASSTATERSPDPVEIFRDESARLVASDPKLDLVVWPETAIASPISVSRLSEVTRALHRGYPPRVPAIPVPLLAGVVVEDGAGAGSPAGQRHLFNSAVLSVPGGGDVRRYDKRALVVVGERSPWSAIPSLGPKLAFEEGARSPVLSLGPHALSVSICYEDIFASSYRESVSPSTDLLVNLTSDQWFAGSAEPAFHLALARYRAVEHRRYLVRATTTGVTAVVAPTGAVIWKLPEDEVAAGSVTVHWIKTKTPYEVCGDWPFALLPLGLVAGAWLKRRRDSQRAPPAYSPVPRLPSPSSSSPSPPASPLTGTRVAG